MTNLIAYDAAYPVPGGVPGTQVVLIYAGGDTPHVWTSAEIAAQPEEYRLPVFVRSDPAGASAGADAAVFVQWLREAGCPAGSATVLDLETAVDVAYVNAFGAAVRAAGFRVLPYGSTSTVFQNPKLDGYFAAAPGEKGLFPNTVATQYSYLGRYDLSYVSPEVQLWAKGPVPNPADPVDTGTHYDAAVPGYGIAGTPELGVIGRMTGSGGYRGRSASGGIPVFAGTGNPTRWAEGFNAKTLPAGTPLAVLLSDAASVSTVEQTGTL